MNIRWWIIMSVGVAYGVAPALFAVLATLLITNVLEIESIIPIIAFVIAFLIVFDVLFYRMAKDRVNVEHPFRLADSVFGAICAGLVFLLPLVIGFMFINFVGSNILNAHLDTTVIALSIALSAGFGMKNVKAVAEFR